MELSKQAATLVLLGSTDTYSIFVHEKHGTELACGFLSGGIKFEYTELVIRSCK
jgi:hypothetical protein